MTAPPRRPPPPPSGDLRNWAQELHRYLTGDALVRQRQEPTPLLLSHLVDGLTERASVNGLCMFDPVDKRPVYSKDGAFVPLANLTSDIATTAEARTGTANNKLMTPARVADRQGRQVISANAQTALVFDQIPQEATEISLLFNSPSAPANSTVRLDFGAGVGSYDHTRLPGGAAYAAPIGANAAAAYDLDTATGAFGIQGVMRLDRFDSAAWWLSGVYRRNVTFQNYSSGRAIGLPTDGSAVLRVTCTAAFTGGVVVANWRI
jgi:hypothetical protein